MKFHILVLILLSGCATLDIFPTALMVVKTSDDSQITQQMLVQSANADATQICKKQQKIVSPTSIDVNSLANNTTSVALRFKCISEETK